MTETQALDAPAPLAPAPSRYTNVPRAWLRVGWPMSALVLLLLFDLFFVPHFFRISINQGHLSGSLIDVFRLAAPVMLVSVGMTLVLATGGVDLSVGAIMALAGAVAAKLMAAPPEGMNVSPWLAALAGLGVAIICGAWNGALVALLDIQPIVATLVLMIAGRGLAMEFVGSGYVDVHGTLFDRLHGYVLGLPAAGLLALTVFGMTGAFARGTSAGLLIEATGANKVASRFAGVNVVLVTFLTYVFSGLCSGIAGMVAAADIQKANAIHTGMYLELDAILAAVIGGTSLTGGRFSLAGALVGALLIQTLTTTLTYKVPIEYTLVVKAIVVLGVCLLQSDTFRRKVFRRGGGA
jgi:simple sugar transport system permease protein